jgi:hypothetical protein
MTDKKALGAQELLKAAENVKAKRTEWLESFGVPISHEFAEFAEAIGALTNAAEAYAARTPETYIAGMMDAARIVRERKGKYTLEQTANYLETLCTSRADSPSGTAETKEK